MKYVRSEKANIHILVESWRVRWEGLQCSLLVLRERLNRSGRRRNRQKKIRAVTNVTPSCRPPTACVPILYFAASLVENGSENNYKDQ